MLFVCCVADHRDLHSFPTRRSSDLRAGAGGDDHGLRERWFGATGKRVPELVLEGDPLVPLDEALVLDDVSGDAERSEEHTSELQSHSDLVCRLLLEKKKEHTRSIAS